MGHPTSFDQQPDLELPRSPVGGHPSSATGQSLHHERSHLARYGPDSHVVFHERPIEAEKVGRVRELVRPPVVRQWIQAGKIHREPSMREIPRFELFLDLLFVGIIHQLADAAIEDPGGPAVARFILTFWPSWSIWEEARKYSNVSGTDDLLHRTWVLVGMIGILGYTANASAIELDVSEDDEGFEHNAVQAAVAFWLVIKLTRGLARGFVELRAPKSARTRHNCLFVIADVEVVVLFIYAWRLPKFRTSQISQAIAVFIPMCVYLPLIWVESRSAQITLAAVGIVVDCLRLDVIAYLIYGRYHMLRLGKRQTTGADEEVWSGRDGDVGHGVQDKNVKGSGANEKRSAGRRALHKMPDMPESFVTPAMNIEHAIERSSAFVVIVLGELVMNLLYTATVADTGVSVTFGKAALGLMVAWALNYLYLLPSEPNAEYEHALRRSWLTAVVWTFLHWPLCASLVLASAASGRMVSQDEVDAGVHWYWGCGLGFALLFINMLDLAHRNLSSASDARIPRPIRAAVSFAGSLALILYSFGGEDLSSIANLAIAVAITWFVLVTYVLGVLPRPAAWRTSRRQGESFAGDEGIKREDGMQSGAGETADGNVGNSDGVGQGRTRSELQDEEDGVTFSTY